MSRELAATLSDEGLASAMSVIAHTLRADGHRNLADTLDEAASRLTERSRQLDEQHRRILAATREKRAALDQIEALRRALGGADQFGADAGFSACDGAAFPNAGGFRGHAVNE